VLEAIPLGELLPLLNRKSLFRVGWGARGATGPKWESLQARFEARLATMWSTAGDYLQPQALYGYFPVQSDGDDLVVYDPEEPQARREVTRFTLPRQPRGERLSLADYFVSVQSGLLDVAAFQVVTVGHGATERFETLRDADEFAEAYFVHGLAAQTTEAIAEWVHRRILRELDLEEGQGHRYSWGYPALPGLEGHRALFCILPAESALGMSLTSAAQLVPELSTAALVVHNPEAKYFVVRQK
jgi:5-methyltetrahydrofolate--homocysteine methyltransferase